MLAGFGSPSTFNPIDPTRLYDSRDGDGPLAGGDTRTVYLGVPVAALQEADVVNLTITDTVDSGYLSLYSAALSSPPLASSINWFTSGQIAANMAITKVDSNGNVKVTAGGPGSTNFVIDLLGWFD